MYRGPLLVSDRGAGGKAEGCPGLVLSGEAVDGAPHVHRRGGTPWAPGMAPKAPPAEAWRPGRRGRFRSLGEPEGRKEGSRGRLAACGAPAPANGTASVSAGPYGASFTGPGSETVTAMPGTYSTSASPEVSVSRSSSGVSWTKIYTLQSVSPAQVTVRSYGSSSVSASYSGPLPGKLCYDDSCSQVSPGAYTKPADSVLDTWTRDGSASCPPGFVGTVTYREYWKRVKYWTPDVVGVSSRGTASFTSVVRDEMYNSPPFGYFSDIQCIPP